MQPDTREMQVFKNLSEGSEGEVLVGYIEKVRRKLTDDLVDQNPTQAEIAGAKIARDILDQIKNQLNKRGIIQSNVERHD